MKLKEILEANMYTVDHSDPSGIGVPTSVDPDAAEEMLDPKATRYSKVGDEHRADRSKRLRKRLKIAKNMKTPKQGGKVVSDNTDQTGSGANSAVNGPYNY
jgi:hypothetical protein